MSYEFYKSLHLFLLMALFFQLGVIYLHYRDQSSEKPKKGLMLAHGLSLLFILISGWGMVAKLKIPLDTWIWAKHLAWLGLGASPVLAKKLPKSYAITLAFALLAVLAVIYRF